MKICLSPLFTWVLLLVLLNCSSQDKEPRFLAVDTAFRVASYNIRYPAKADDSSGNGWQNLRRPMVELMLSNQAG